MIDLDLLDLELILLKGGPGSGNWGHAGVAGHEGGSAPNGGGSGYHKEIAEATATGFGGRWEDRNGGEFPLLFQSEGEDGVFQRKRNATAAEFKQNGETDVWELGIQKDGEFEVIRTTAPETKESSDYIEFEANQSQTASLFLDSVPPLTDRERKAVKEYGFGSSEDGGSVYSEINGALRHDSLEALGPNEKVTLQHLESAVQKSRIPQNTILYRGVYDRDFLPKTEGSIFADKGFLSTTLNRKTAEMGFSLDTGAIMRIKAPKGQKGLFVEGITGMFEMEVILPRGAKMKIDRITERDGEAPIYDVSYLEEGS